jgi:general secretion pathway protein J
MRRMRRARGFTLIELLVALFALALLAALSWRGLDGMMRARTQTEARADEVLTLQTGLAQWAADLDAIVQFPGTTALDWNGRVLRLTRQASGPGADGALVVAWTRREGRWLRWQSPPVASRGNLETAWQLADLWSQNASESMKRQEVAVVPLEDWQIFFYRSDAWTNPLSSDATQSPTAGTGAAAFAAAATGQVATNVLPEGVRLVLQLPGGRAISGRLMRDWVRPTLGGGKS